MKQKTKPDFEVPQQESEYNKVMQDYAAKMQQFEMQKAMMSGLAGKAYTTNAINYDGYNLDIQVPQKEPVSPPVIQQPKAEIPDPIEPKKRKMVKHE